MTECFVCPACKQPHESYALADDCLIDHVTDSTGMTLVNSSERELLARGENMYGIVRECCSSCHEVVEDCVCSGPE